MNKKQVAVFVGYAFIVGFFVGNKVTAQAVNKRLRAYVTKVEDVVKLAMDAQMYAVAGYYDDSISADEYNETIKEKLKFLDIVSEM